MKREEEMTVEELLEVNTRLQKQIRDARNKTMRLGEAVKAADYLLHLYMNGQDHYGQIIKDIISNALMDARMCDQ